MGCKDTYIHAWFSSRLSFWLFACKDHSAKYFQQIQETVVFTVLDFQGTSYTHTNQTESGDFVVKRRARSAIIDQSAQETGDFHFLSGATATRALADIPWNTDWFIAILI